MAENSGIEWTHHTFNPWIGCTKVSAACDHCYAEAWDKRFSGGERWGARAPRTRTSAANWAKPYKWNKQAEADGVRLRVFCASLADVFDNHRSIDPGWRADLWQLIDDTPHLDWLLLTKRPQNIAAMMPSDVGLGGNRGSVWIGTTVENQAEADRRIPHLLSTPAAVRFLSCEPLLGPIKLECIWLGGRKRVDGRGCVFGEGPVGVSGGRPSWQKPPHIDWVITGGESGSNFRPADPDWFRSLRDQCSAAGVPFLFKQWEGRHQREIKARGRELDGVVWDGYPTPEAAA
ncbi:MAG: phage Gp37/Gp68 family protein [Pseudomonadota bacterium]